MAKSLASIESGLSRSYKNDVDHHVSVDGHLASIKAELSHMNEHITGRNSRLSS
jgi:hypothetical protein